MIFSLAIMQGVTTKNAQDVNMQQIGAAAAWGSSKTEGGTSAVLSYTVAVAGSVAGGGAWWVAPTPVGLGYWAVTGAFYL